VVVRTVVDDDLVQTMKQVAEDVVMLAHALPPKHGAF
jgi:hypothetical protein